MFNWDETQLEFFMEECFDLAKKAQGRTSPNPLVGAVVLDKNGFVVGRGFHSRSGDHHAEVNALVEAGDKAKDGTLFVNLEPCCHIGKTGPCVDAIIKSGIREVVFSNYDPNNLVNGKGEKTLKESGIRVISGILKSGGEELNKFFFKWIKNKIPYVTLKQAQTLNGKVGMKNSPRIKISSDEALKEVHRLRNIYDAILVGARTVICDNPALTSRGSEHYRNPKRVIVDTKLITDPSSKVFIDNAEIFLVTLNSQKEKLNKYLEKNKKIQVIFLKEKENNYIDFNDLFVEIGKHNILSLMVESGPSIATQLVIDNLIDEYMLLISPVIFNENNCTSSLDLETYNSHQLSYSFGIVSYTQIGNDLKVTLVPNKFEKIGQIE